MSKGKRFYKDGIRFTCRGDGKCCLTRGGYGHVYLSFNDRRRLAAHLKLSLAQFTARYTVREDGLVELKYEDRDCPFLKENRCVVYEARPRQCRTWPFWPENMDSDVWEREVASYCPGADSGRLFTAEEIEDILANRKDVSGLPRL